MKSSPHELIEACRRGDNTAWSELLRGSRGLVYSICAQYTTSPEDADDLVQEVLLRIWQRLADYDPSRGELKAWIGTLTRNLCVDTWRRSSMQERYPTARRLLITADAGGSNGYRTRLWKVELQKLADETGLTMTVCHFPPGTSKWHKIEHRLFSFISKTWRGHPLDGLATIVNLICHTTTENGLYVEASLDYASYEKGIKVTDAEMDELHLKRDKFHGEWNYSLLPRSE